MLSATRLTYGSGNDALNRIIFDHLFKRNERQLGALSFDTKVELLINRGVSSNIEVMMGYTLFGDPAMKLAMADYEMQPKVKSKTVVPGGAGRNRCRSDTDCKLRPSTQTKTVFSDIGLQR